MTEPTPTAIVTFLDHQGDEVRTWTFPLDGRPFELELNSHERLHTERIVFTPYPPRETP